MVLHGIVLLALARGLYLARHLPTLYIFKIIYMYMMYPKSVEINSCRKDLIEAQISRSIHVETGTYHSESSSSLKDTALVGKLRTEWEAFNLDHRNFNFREETESGKEEFC